MIVECNHCRARVDGKVLAEAEQELSPNQSKLPFKVALVQCPVCKRHILAGQELQQIGEDEWDWEPARRLWPEPEEAFVWRFPFAVSASIREAGQCYKAKAYSACAVMCGRALEAICREFKTERKALAGGLKELLEKEVIDKRIFRWSEALREHRNIAAHVTEERITKEDARDLLDFANAICEYIFVLSERFQDFMHRKKEAQQK